MKRFVVHPKPIKASEDVEDSSLYEIIEDLIYDAQNKIPYEAASSEAKFKKLALEYVQQSLINKYNYTEADVTDRKLVRLIKQVIVESEGSIW